jgi:murein DD-endopeptidase / murein LD-carboxypeptidase
VPEQRGLSIPDAFWTVIYNGRRFPGGAGVYGLAGGANCQHFAYELLRQNGFLIGQMRSSELLADRRDTALVEGAIACGDLLLFNSTPHVWGAHVAVVLGASCAIHLSKTVGRAAVWTLDEFTADPAYACFIGAKRPIRYDAAGR